MKKCERSASRHRGFTLVEFMIASTLGLIVIAAVGSLFIYTRKLNDVAQARVVVQQDLRTAAAMITRDARMAGNFGCMSLGRLYGTDINKDVSTKFAIAHGSDAPTGIARLTDNPADSGGSFGVRWIREADIQSNNDIAAIKNRQFTPRSGALLFYYGVGSSGLQRAAGNRLTFADDSPNQIVRNTAQNKGFVVIASCLAANIQSASKTDNDKMVFDVPNLIAASTTAVPKVNEQSTGEATLMRYMVTAYLLGDVAGEPTSLYRLELQDNGQWGPPELLARNVTAMSADYVFVPDCPSVTASEPNSYTFTVRSADQGDTILNTGREPRPPVAVNLTLTYDYTKAFGQDTAAQMTGNTFRIDATIRGGNVCADRKLPAPTP